MAKKLSLTGHAELRFAPAASRTEGHQYRSNDHLEDATRRAILSRVPHPHAHASSRNQISNRESHLLEPLASCRKHTMEVWSNRNILRGSLPAAPRPRVTTSRHTVVRTYALQIAGEERHRVSWKPDSRHPETNTGLDTLCRASFPGFPLPAILVFNLQPGCAIEPEAITGEEIE